MLKVFILVVALALPIFGGPIDDEANFENAMKEICVNEVKMDYDQIKRLYSDYDNCTTNTIDPRRIREELAPFVINSFETTETFTLSTQQKNDLVALSQKYCPRVDMWLECLDIIIPFENECYDDNALKGRKVGVEIIQHLAGFFCKNESATVTSFIDEKIVECAVKIGVELKNCVRTKKPIMNRLLPDVDSVCGLIDNIGRCAVPLFEQCELSQTAGTLVRSLFTDLQTGTACANFTSINNAS